jgi:chemotaxis receptor (MCP) glutamine deamidase CheD
LRDGRNRFGGINPFLYPATTELQNAAAEYGNGAILMLIRMRLAEGSEKASTEAQIFGGGESDLTQESGIRRKKMMVTKKILNHQGIQITSEDIGGSKRRELIDRSGTDQVVVSKIDRIKRDDWHPLSPHPNPLSDGERIKVRGKASR